MIQGEHMYGIFKDVIVFCDGMVILMQAIELAQSSVDCIMNIMGGIKL